MLVTVRDKIETTQHLSRTLWPPYSPTFLSQLYSCNAIKWTTSLFEAKLGLESTLLHLTSKVLLDWYNTYSYRCRGEWYPGSSRRCRYSRSVWWSPRASSRVSAGAWGQPRPPGLAGWPNPRHPRPLQWEVKAAEA